MGIPRKKIFYLFLFWMILSMGYQNCGTQFQTSTDALSSEDISSPKKVTIQISSPSAEVFENDPISFVILYGGDVDASTISLNTNQILLGGSDPAGCEVLEVTGEGVMRSVAIGNCSGTGTVNISLSAGTARSVGGELAPSFGPSESFRVDNTEVVPPSEVCPENYILVPALAGYTTQDFCVAKYEMKNVGGVATSQAANNPWVTTSPWNTLPRGDLPTTVGGAWKACRDLGAKYDLISNAQWQTIARNIETVASNWSTSSVGSGSLNRGHSDGVPGNGLAADVDDNNACANTGQSCSSTVWDSQRRTHKLSNGKVIWDFAGNVWEWVNDNNSTNFGVDAYMSQVTTASHTAAGSGTLNGAAKQMFGPAGNYVSLGASEYGGLGFGWINPSPGGAVIRGGDCGNGVWAGVFAVYLSLAPSHSGPYLGFRCVFVP